MEGRLVDKQVLYSGKKVHLEVHHLEDEATGRRTKREVVVHPGAVVILPVLDEAARQILLIRNRRYSVRQVLLELPAGTLEKGEDPMNCAGRELLEETGYLAGRIKPLGSFFSSPGILTERMYAFVAYDLQQRRQQLDEGEDIEVEQVSMTDALDLIRTGQIMDAKTIAALLMYDKFGARPVAVPTDE